MVATVLSLVGALANAHAMTFGFRMAPEAAHTLAMRILSIRLFGVAFAMTLLLMVVIGRSRAARGALILRWVLGLSTSTVMLRGVGVMTPIAGDGVLPIAASAVQLVFEGLAIATLYGDDAATWFERATDRWDRPD